LTPQGICFFDLKNLAVPALKFYSFAKGKATLLREFPKETRVNTASTTLSVSPDGQWIIYTQLDQAGSDLNDGGEFPVTARHVPRCVPRSRSVLVNGPQDQPHLEVLAAWCLKAIRQ
jgi:hypothetical protein